ncbi:hypothetical protein LCGC14_1758880 [marine sediment metagenome]|uniref:Uncharacterized protein n=1 Tax=marine sediment metagenome TaxID=412755 RepID=A0A0F9HNY4_9ZZZZ
MNTTILSLEIRVGILEDRLACIERYSNRSQRKRDRVTQQLEVVRAELKKEKESYYEFLRMRCPG